MKDELYRFVEDGTVWTVTSANASIVHNLETYTPATVGRSEVESRSELSKANLEIKFDLGNAMARRWMSERIERTITLTLFEVDGVDVSIAWKGRLAACKPSPTEIVLVFDSIFTSLRRPGLRARYTRSCRHSLYGRGCLLDKEDFAEDGIITAIAAGGQVVTVTEAGAFDNGWFTTGMIEGPDGSLRYITDHTGTQLTLIRPFETLLSAVNGSGWGNGWGNYWGGSVAVCMFPGCARTRAVCNTKFSNLPNYGGFDWIPLRNPFDGSSII